MQDWRWFYGRIPTCRGHTECGLKAGFVAAHVWGPRFPGEVYIKSDIMAMVSFKTMMAKNSSRAVAFMDLMHETGKHGCLEQKDCIPKFVQTLKQDTMFEMVYYLARQHKGQNFDVFRNLTAHHFQMNTGYYDRKEKITDVEFYEDRPLESYPMSSKFSRPNARNSRMRRHALLRDNMSHRAHTAIRFRTDSIPKFLRVGQKHT